jgi:very-short-patch-repair endonuclease
MSLSRNNKLILVAKHSSRKLRRDQTGAETLFWNAVRDRRFMGLKFYRQHPLFIELDGKETFFIADFYCHERRTVVEIDGKIHDYKKKRDDFRTTIISSLGFKWYDFGMKKSNVISVRS